jgi:hypothetical protein
MILEDQKDKSEKERDGKTEREGKRRGRRKSDWKRRGRASGKDEEEDGRLSD